MKNEILKILAQKGWQQKDLCEKINMWGYPISQSFLNRIINKKKKPPLEVYVLIAWILGQSQEGVWKPTIHDLCRDHGKNANFDNRP